MHKLAKFLQLSLYFREKSSLKCVVDKNLNCRVTNPVISADFKTGAIPHTILPLGEGLTKVFLCALSYSGCDSGIKEKAASAPGSEINIFAEISSPIWRQK